MTEALQQEIRTLNNVFESERDPEGRVFAPLADAYRRAGEVQQAVRLLNEGLARHPDFVPGHVVAAQLYVEQGLTEEGAIAARRALQLDAENVMALRSLLQVLERGQDPEADDVRARLGTLDPGYVADGGGAAIGVDEATPSAPEPAMVDDDDGAEPRPALQETAALSAVPPDLELTIAAEETAAEEPLIELDTLPPIGLADDAPDTVGPAEAAPEPDVELPTEEPVVALDDLTPVSADDVSDREPAAAMGAAELPAELAVGPEEPVMELADLAPAGAETDEPVVELSSLAPEEPAEAAEEVTVVDLGSLAPDEPADEEEEDEVVALADLAPDAEEAEEEPVMDLSDLAPSEPDEDATVMDVTSLAPDEPAEAEEEGEEVVALADLAPDADEEPLAIGDLAPEPAEEPVMELADLAPAEPDADADEEPVVELSSLAPEESAEEESAEIDEEEPVVDLGSLAPDEPAPETDVTMVDLVDETAEPDEEEGEPEAVTADAAPEGDADDHEPGEPVYTRTLAELYVKQGAVGQAVEVYKHLGRLSPDDESIQRRIEELESGSMLEEEGPSVLPDETEEEVETLARELAENGEGGDEAIESPFTMDDEPDEADAAADAGPTIGEYFHGLLGWKSGKGS